MTLLIDGPAALLSGLIDYAGIFPPSSLSLGDAVDEYRAARRSNQAWMLGRFLVTTSRLEDLAGMLTRSMVVGEQPWSIGAIVDEPAGSGALHSQVFGRHMSPAARVGTVEARLPKEASDGRSARDAEHIVRPIAEALVTISGEVVPYLEVVVGAEWQTGVPAAVAALAGTRRHMLRSLGAKLRTGGTVPEAFPAPEQVATFILACRRNGLSYKATAGLHHPVRHRDEALGVMRHGFLNMLAAAALAQEGAPHTLVVAAISEEDPKALAVGATGLTYRDRRIPIPAIRDMRNSLFPAYGSCSFDEPVADLKAMGILT